MSSGQPTTGGEERVRDLLSSADVETLRQQLETQLQQVRTYEQLLAAGVFGVHTAEPQRQMEAILALTAPSPPRPSDRP